MIVDSHANAFISKKYQVNSTYSKAIKQFYNADTTNQDFSSPSTAANKINGWVNSKTRGMIPSLIDQGDILNLALEIILILYNSTAACVVWNFDKMFVLSIRFFDIEQNFLVLTDFQFMNLA